MQILVNISDDGSVTASTVHNQPTQEATTIVDTGNSMDAGASPFSTQQNKSVEPGQQFSTGVTEEFNGGAKLQSIN